MERITTFIINYNIEVMIDYPLVTILFILFIIYILKLIRLLKDIINW